VADRVSAAESASSDSVILVDGNDAPIGTSSKLDAHRRGLRHRAVSVILRDSRDRLLLQQRAAGKYHSGGQWTNTCCSHPRPGEASAEAAARRLEEEMGIRCTLTPLFTTHYRAEVSNGLVEDEVVHAFAGRFDGVPVPDPTEVAGWVWKTSAEIARDVAERPEAYTPWFRIYCRRFWADMTG